MMPPPLNWAVLPEMVLLVSSYRAAAIVDAAAAADAKSSARLPSYLRWCCW